MYMSFITAFFSLFLSWYLYIEHGVAGFNYANRYSWLEQLMRQTSQP